MILVSNYGWIEVAKCCFSIWSNSDFQTKTKIQTCYEQLGQGGGGGPLRLFQMLEEHQQSVHPRLLLKHIINKLIEVK